MQSEANHVHKNERERDGGVFVLLFCGNSQFQLQSRMRIYTVAQPGSVLQLGVTDSAPLFTRQTIHFTFCYFAHFAINMLGAKTFLLFNGLLDFKCSLILCPGNRR